MAHIRACQSEEPVMPKAAEGKKPKKITETRRDTLLKRPFAPSVTPDPDVPGLALHVTTRRSFWALSYQPRGVNPATGRR